MAGQKLRRIFVRKRGNEQRSEAPLWAITGEPGYRLRHSSRGKLGATLDPGAWAGARIVPDWVLESSRAIVTVREGVGYAYSGWTQRELVRWFTHAS